VHRMIRSASLIGYEEVARAAGLEPGAMLRKFRIPSRCLWDPEVRVPVDSVRQLLEESANRSGIENLGLLMAETRKLSDMGPLGLLIREQPTLRQALEACAHYANRLNEALFLHIEEAGSLVVVREELLFEGLGPARQSTELAIGVIFRVLRHFLGDLWRPRRVCFAHLQPRDRTAHNRLFGVRVEFGRDFNGIVCSRSDLAGSNAHADKGIARLAKRLLDSDAPVRQTNVSAHVRQVIVRTLSTGTCSIETVAQQMGVDRRTVHRRLLKEGVNFSQLFNSVKIELATRYLEDPRRRLAGVAELLGFSTLSGFSRWHRAQFGSSASARRAKLIMSLKGKEQSRKANSSSRPATKMRALNRP
jgi:AraC-like DNA-binding protein